jgi:agmatinase
VVGIDLCEVVPGPRGDEWDAAVGARLLYKMIGCAKMTRR